MKKLAMIIAMIAGVASAQVPVFWNGTNLTAKLGGSTNALSVWKNPASATNWTWTKTATNVTMTGYTGPNDVVVPDMIDGLPVTGFGTIFSPSEEGSAITSIYAKNVTRVESHAFELCASLARVDLPSVRLIGISAFMDCSALTAFNMSPEIVSINGLAFGSCSALTSVVFSCDAPAIASTAYGFAYAVTNYVSNPTATGWSNSLAGRAVVRMPVYGDTFHGSGASLTNITAEQVRFVLPLPSSAGISGTVYTNLTGALFVSP